jgi:hypothetical protein
VFKRIFAVFISSVMLAMSFASQSAQGQTGRDTEAIAQARIKIEKLGVGANARVEVKLLDGTKLKGYVSAKDQGSFTVTDRQTGASSVVRYSEVSEVKKPGGRFSTNSWIILGSVVAGAVVTWIIVKPAFCDGGAQTRGIC